MWLGEGYGWIGLFFGLVVVVGVAIAAGPLVALVLALLVGGLLMVPLVLLRRRDRVGTSDRLVGPEDEQEDTHRPRPRGEPASGGS